MIYSVPFNFDAKLSQLNILKAFHKSQHLITHSITFIFVMCCPTGAINKTGTGLAYFCLCLNIFLPGFGTMVNSCAGFFSAAGFCYGLLQLLLAVTLVGWVWSIVYGCEIVRKSKGAV